MVQIAENCCLSEQLADRNQRLSWLLGLSTRQRVILRMSDGNRRMRKHYRTRINVIIMSFSIIFTQCLARSEASNRSYGHAGTVYSLWSFVNDITESGNFLCLVLWKSVITFIKGVEIEAFLWKPQEFYSIIYSRWVNQWVNQTEFKLGVVDICKKVKHVLEWHCRITYNDILRLTVHHPWKNI